MKLSKPIYILKSQAKKLKKEGQISQVDALNLIARKEGFQSWSHLKKSSEDNYPSSYKGLLNYLNAGDLVLIGSRPGNGKTSFAMGLLAQAIKERGLTNYCFSLSEIHKDIAGRLDIYDNTIGNNVSNLKVDFSDEICASYIISKCQKSISKNSLIVVDYLQLLDEQRTKDSIQKQVEDLKEFAIRSECIIIFISQLDRKMEYEVFRYPTVEDIRLPNPLDLRLINKKVLIHKGREITEVIINDDLERKFQVGWDREKIKFT